MKYLILLILLPYSCFSQNGKVYDTYKTSGSSTNESHGSIFPKPFQEYNYIKTHRGIEVYETYKSKSYNTNESKGTIFSKPFPKYIIINDKMYETYKTRSNSTNESRGTIFTKPFESKQIFNKSNTINNSLHRIVYQQVMNNEPLPKYNGESDISYGE